MKILNMQTSLLKPVFAIYSGYCLNCRYIVLYKVGSKREFPRTTRNFGLTMQRENTHVYPATPILTQTIPLWRRNQILTKRLVQKALVHHRYLPALPTLVTRLCARAFDAKGCNFDAMLYLYCMISQANTPSAQAKVVRCTPTEVW